MAGSVHDQAHLAGLFDAGDVARLFSASAEVRAMLLVEGALAKAQGAAGVIPEVSAQAIHRATLELQIDPGGLSAATATNGVSVPALVEAFRTQMQAPEHAQYVHWGATSQDIIDTGLMLRLRQAAGLIADDLRSTVRALATLAEAHAETPMAGRSYGQQAAPTSFGAVVASWGWPLLGAVEALDALEFPVSLGGAIGTGSALGPDPAVLRKVLAEALGLADPGRVWHSDRAPIRAFTGACGEVLAGLDKFAEDLLALTQSEVNEVSLGGGGSSSTMPQKQNPVAPSVIAACARMGRGLEVALGNSATHRFQRDGAAWFTEWMALPQIALTTATATRHAATLAPKIAPNTERMGSMLAGDGLLFAETLTFALARTMPRPEAAKAVKVLAGEVRETGTPLPELARARFPDLPGALFAPAGALGAAPDEARAFAKAARA
jgi:3-carboxy-cis,cis-muconate cycloisomerase